jgi:hypothetical protein
VLTMIVNAVIHIPIKNTALEFAFVILNIKKYNTES